MKSAQNFSAIGMFWLNFSGNESAAASTTIRSVVNTSARDDWLSLSNLRFCPENNIKHPVELHEFGEVVPWSDDHLGRKEDQALPHEDLQALTRTKLTTLLSLSDPGNDVHIKCPLRRASLQSLERKERGWLRNSLVSSTFE